MDVYSNEVQEIIRYSGGVLQYWALVILVGILIGFVCLMTMLRFSVKSEASVEEQTGVEETVVLIDLVMR